MPEEYEPQPYHEHGNGGATPGNLVRRFEGLPPAGKLAVAAGVGGVVVLGIVALHNRTSSSGTKPLVAPDGSVYHLPINGTQFDANGDPTQSGGWLGHTPTSGGSVNPPASTQPGARGEVTPPSGPAAPPAVPPPTIPSSTNPIPAPAASSPLAVASSQNLTNRLATVPIPAPTSEPMAPRTAAPTSEKMAPRTIRSKPISEPMAPRTVRAAPISEPMAPRPAAPVRTNSYATFAPAPAPVHGSTRGIGSGGGIGGGYPDAGVPSKVARASWHGGMQSRWHTRGGQAPAAGIGSGQAAGIGGGPTPAGLHPPTSWRGPGIVTTAPGRLQPGTWRAFSVHRGSNH